MLCIRGKPGKNPKGKFAFPLGFSLAFLGQKPTNYRLLKRMADVAVIFPCLCSPSTGPGWLPPWRRSGGAEPPAFPFAEFATLSSKHDCSYFCYSCVSPVPLHGSGPIDRQNQNSKQLYRRTFDFQHFSRLYFPLLHFSITEKAGPWLN